MKDNNKIHDAVLPFVSNLPNTYNQVLYLYEQRLHLPLGMVDCGIYALAMAEYCKYKGIAIEEYMKDHSLKWHPHSYLFILYSFIDVSITLKLNNIPVLAALSDAAFIRAKATAPTPDILFMEAYNHGCLLTDSVDTDRVEKEYKVQWFRICLLALESFKKAQRIAILDSVNMPIREALLALQIQAIHFAMVQPETKNGLTLNGINTLAYNHDVTKAAFRNISESACKYLGDIYRKKTINKIITKPYEFSPNAIMGL